MIPCENCGRLLYIQHEHQYIFNDKYFCTKPGVTNDAAPADVPQGHQKKAHRPKSSGAVPPRTEA